jgi:hypothetical protein
MVTGSTENHSEAPASYWIAALVQMNTEKKVGSMLSKLGYPK